MKTINEFKDEVLKRKDKGSRGNFGRTFRKNRAAEKEMCKI